MNRKQKKNSQKEIEKTEQCSLLSTFDFGDGNPSEVACCSTTMR